MDSFAILAILLLLAGLAILIAEVFLPSGGILFSITAVTLIASLCCAYAAWWRASPQSFWVFCGIELMAVPAALVGAFTVLPQTKFGKKMLLDAPDAERVTPFVKETARLEQLIGHVGVTQTLLNPGGIVLVDGERHHSFTDGLLLDPGATVEVVEVRGTRLLVRLPSKHQPFEPEATAPEPSPLDFEIPQS